MLVEKILSISEISPYFYSFLFIAVFHTYVSEMLCKFYYLLFKCGILINSVVQITFYFYGLSLFLIMIYISPINSHSNPLVTPESPGCNGSPVFGLVSAGADSVLFSVFGADSEL